MNKGEKSQSLVKIPDEVIISKIYLIRGKKVMLDRDLSELYGVSTRRLKEQVRRNINRFPDDFMFELTKKELENWRSQFATSNREKLGMRILPFAFTEHGVLMLSSVLNSERAVQVNIRIMRTYTRLRELLLTNKDLLIKVEKIERKLSVHDASIKVVFDYLEEFIKEQEARKRPRRQIGFKVGGKR